MGKGHGGRVKKTLHPPQPESSRIHSRSHEDGMTTMFDLPSVQAALVQQGLDGWLLYDFRGLNILARRVVGLAPPQMLSPRWVHYGPPRGEPCTLTPRLAPPSLAALPAPPTRSLCLPQ